MKHTIPNAFVIFRKNLVPNLKVNVICNILAYQFSKNFVKLLIVYGPSKNKTDMILDMHVIIGKKALTGLFLFRGYHILVLVVALKMLMEWRWHPHLLKFKCNCVSNDK